MNDHVDLKWQAADLYGLLLFEILRVPAAAQQLRALAKETETQSALPIQGTPNSLAGEQLDGLISSLAGEYMGRHKKRGRVFTWIPRTFKRCSECVFAAGVLDCLEGGRGGDPAY